MGIKVGSVFPTHNALMTFLTVLTYSLFASLCLNVSASGGRRARHQGPTAITSYNKGPAYPHISTNSHHRKQNAYSNIDTLVASFLSGSIQVPSHLQSAEPLPLDGEKPLKLGSVGTNRSKLIVETREGALMGKREDNGVHKPYLSFKGIPYAKPPLRQLRFRSPVQHPVWDGIRMAFEYQNACLGYFVRFLIGDEDCLYLNTFVPENAKPVKGDGLPVVVWIHGGAFIHGSEMMPILYQPGTFTDRGVIFITINYRLGPLGFISTDDRVLPGNYGFKDMVMALKWVNRNIRAFGGDPKQVHLMGQSGGAVSAHALSLSPMSQGLFSTVISMSGSLLDLWGSNPRAKPIADRLARYLKCPTQTSKEILTCFRQRGAKEIILGISDFFLLGVRYAVPFTASIDPFADDPFMPEHPLKILTKKNFQPVPYIFGTVPKEMNLFLPAVVYDRDMYERITNDFENSCSIYAYAFVHLPDIMPAPEDTKKFCERAKSVYFGVGEIDADESGENLVRFATDVMIRFGVYAAALVQAKFSSAPVYYYSWDHSNEGALRLVDVMNQVYDMRLHSLLTNSTRIRSFRLESGQSHTDDLMLMFDPPNFRQGLTEADKTVKNFVADTFRSFWMNDGKISVDGITWPEFNQETQEFLSFTAKPSIKRRGFKDSELELMSNLYDLFHRTGRVPAPSLSLMLGFQELGPTPLTSATMSNDGHQNIGALNTNYGAPPMAPQQYQPPAKHYGAPPVQIDHYQTYQHQPQGSQYENFW